MNYAEVRDQINTGDLIAIRGRRGLFAALTRWVTRSPYTHTGIAVWVGAAAQRRLLVAESKASGDSLVPLSQYAAVDFDVYDTPRYIQLAVDDAIWQVLGNHVGYDFGDLVRIALNRLFGVPLPERDDSQMVCSALSASIWLRAGWVPVDLPSIPAPCDVARAQAIPPRFEVRSTDPWNGRD